MMILIFEDAKIHIEKDDESICDWYVVKGKNNQNYQDLLTAFKNYMNITKEMNSWYKITTTTDRHICVMHQNEGSEKVAKNKKRNRFVPKITL